MPDGEQRAWQRRQRAEVNFTQRGRQARVLHPHLDRQRTAGGFIKTKQTSAPVAAKQANGVMQDHRDNHHQADGGDMGGGTRHHRADDRQNAHHREGGQERLYRFHHLRQQMMDNQSQRDRNDHNLQNAEQHAHDVDLNMRVDVQTGEQRCRHDADEGGDRGDGHRQRHIPFGKKDHHVGGGPAGDAADQHHPGGKLRRHMKQQRQQPGGERHHQIMEKDPCSDRRRARQDAFEILQLQMHTHTEHDQHQQGGDPWANWGEGGGSVIGQNGEQQCP